MRTVQQLRDDFEIVQNIEEFEELLLYVNKIKPSFIIEIGTERGGSLQAWNDVLGKNGYLIGIDLSDTVRWDKFKKSCSLKFIEGDSSSEKTINEVYDYMNKHHHCPSHVDFLFLDGDHTYEGVKKDFEAYKGLVRKNGLIAFHDINISISGLDGVTKLWFELRKQYKNKTIHSRVNGIGIGIIQI